MESVSSLALMADGGDDEAGDRETYRLPMQLLAQLRGLDYVCAPKAMVEQMLECVDVLPLVLQREIIVRIQCLMSHPLSQFLCSQSYNSLSMYSHSSPSALPMKIFLTVREKLHSFCSFAFS